MSSLRTSHHDFAPMGLPLLQLLRLASPSLPVGAYSYSQGLESAIDQGWVHDAPSATAWIEQMLQGPLGQFEAPWLADALQACAQADAPQLNHINALLLASRDSREPRMEWEQMGYSLTQLLQAWPETQARYQAWPEPKTWCFPVAYAWVATAWAIPAPAALTGYLWGWLENQIMVLLKALPMGQTAGQQLLSHCLPALERCSEQAWHCPPAQRSNFAPGLSWLAMQHETQYSRLFRS